MNKEAVAERLRALACNDEKRSKAARLHDVLDDVERALAAGAKRADVLAELCAHGLGMSFSTFETTLKRLRAKRRAASRLILPVQPHRAKLTAQATSPILRPVGTGAVPSHDPADLNRIVNTRPDLLELARHAKRRKK